jgi:hypothetical protein
MGILLQVDRSQSTCTDALPPFLMESPFLCEFVYQSEPEIKAWYRKVMQVPVIEEGGIYYFVDRAERARIQTYNSQPKPLELAAFMQRFYPSPSR